MPSFSVYLWTALLLAPVFADKLPIIGDRSRDEGDSVYFPEQVDYLKTWLKVCPDKVYWPINGRCWPSGTRGPCDLGRVIVLDKEAVDAKCVPDSEVVKYPFQNVITP